MSFFHYVHISAWQRSVHHYHYFFSTLSIIVSFQNLDDFLFVKQISKNRIFFLKRDYKMKSLFLFKLCCFLGGKIWPKSVVHNLQFQLRGWLSTQIWGLNIEIGVHVLPFCIIYLHVLPTLDSISQIKLNTICSNFDLPKIRIQRSTCTTINLARSARQVKIAL